MLIKFLQSGVSPEIGDFAKDEERGIPDMIARVYIARKQAVEVKPAKPVAKVEVKDDGK